MQGRGINLIQMCGNEDVSSGSSGDYPQSEVDVSNTQSKTSARFFFFVFNNGS